jgi:hypothetical protein
MDALKVAGLSFPLLQSDIIDNVQPWILLMCVVYLFQVLPHYVPKGSIYFKAHLGVPLMKSIELANPSKKTVTYICSLYGAPDFRLCSSSHDPIKIM